MISFCTPVKGRLHYLQTTYIANLKAVKEAGIPAEFVLVDYDSPDGMSDWVLANLRPFADIVSFYRLTESRPNYYIPVADNVAFNLARGQFVSNLMADTFVTPAYFRTVYDLIRPSINRLVRPQRDANTGTTGLLTLWKEKFVAIGGYDEQMKGWGYQDVDLRHRCDALKMEMVHWPPAEARSMPHGDELRIQFASVKDAPKQTNDFNKELSRKNVKAKRLVANVGLNWGEAAVDRIPL